MANYDDELRRWRDAGLIDGDTAGRIRAFEQNRAEPAGDRPGVAEALVYVGLAAVGVGAFALGALLWDELTTLARVLAMLVPGVVAVGFGAILLRSVDAPLRRGGTVAWLAAVPLLAGAFAIVLSETDVDGERVFLATAGLAAALAIGAWVLSPSSVQVVGMAIAVAAVCVAAGAVAEGSDFAPQRGQAVAAGLTALLALAWLAMVELNWLTPVTTARVPGAAGLALGTYLGGFDSEWQGAFEVGVIAAGGLLVALSVTRGSFVYMVFGVGALFVGAVTMIMRRVPDPVVGAVVVMLAGIVLTAAVLLLARWRPWRQAEQAG